MEILYYLKTLSGNFEKSYCAFFDRINFPLHLHNMRNTRRKTSKDYKK